MVSRPLIACALLLSLSTTACDADDTGNDLPLAPNATSPADNLAGNAATRPEPDAPVDRGADDATEPTERAATEPSDVTAPCDAVAAMTAADLVQSCRYDNPFASSAECREYRGPWTTEGIEGDCGAVFTGVAGVLSEDPCEVSGMVGRCVAESDGGEVLSVFFYKGEGAQLEPLCGQFLEGTFCAEDGSSSGTATKTPLEEALAHLASDDEVLVEPSCLDDACLEALIEARQGIVLSPVAKAPTAGLVIYPGALVDPRAYAPVARQMAQLGLKVIIVPMPGELAINGYDRALDVMTEDIERWFISGHSMGGAMAARLAYEEPELDALAGLILWAAYPSGFNDISDRGLPVLSIAGALDGVATPEEIEAAKPYLPAATEYVMLEGGNHAQFGTYGAQDGDLTATLSTSEQQQLIAAVTVHFVGRVLTDVVPPTPAFDALPAASDWCETAQSLVAGLDAALLTDAVSVTAHGDEDAFASSKADIDAETASGWIQVQAYVRPFGNARVLDAPAILEGDVWCKMKSRPAVTAALAADTDAPAATCAAMNAAAVAWAEGQAGESRPINFADDVLYDTGISWLKDGTLTLEAGTLTSPHFTVENDTSLPELYREVFYCKLWSPTRALYYVTTGE